MNITIVEQERAATGIAVMAEERSTLAEREGGAALAEAQAAVIATPADYALWGEARKRVTAKMNALEVERTFFTKPLNVILRRINAAASKGQDLWGRAKTTLDGKLIGYEREQERLRQEEERKAREAALKEQERLREQAERKATKLEEQGKAERAELVRAGVPEIPLPVLPQVHVPKVAGLSTRENWQWKCTLCGRRDCTHLTEALPREYLAVDEVAVNRVVKALKDRTNLTNVVVWDQGTMAVRGT